MVDKAGIDLLFVTKKFWLVNYSPYFLEVLKIYFLKAFIGLNY